jgi:TonB family protein
MMAKAPAPALLALLAMVSLSSSALHAASSIWKSAPPPKFPAASLKRGAEGYVVIRAYVGPDGAVMRTTISKSSGDSTLDEAARTAVLTWRMKEAVIKPEYQTKGYALRIDFEQEAPAIVQYRDRTEVFANFESTKIWMSAPAPEYPYEARRGRIEGVTYLKVLIGPDGRPAKIDLVKGSGSVHLDSAAIAAVRWWRAHKRYAGKERLVPVTFTLHRLR